MSWFLAAAPLFIVLELVQLVACERLLGLKRLASGRDPRSTPVKEPVAALWTILLFVYWIWIGLVLGGPAGRLQAVALFLVSLGGFVLRRNLTLKWILVVLTFEGAIRIGMLVSLCGVFWRQLP